MDWQLKIKFGSRCKAIISASIRSIFIISMVFISCEKDTMHIAEHCEIEAYYDFYKLSSNTLDWIPYEENDTLFFKKNDRQIIKLYCESSRSVIEDIYVRRLTLCPEDSTLFMWSNFKIKTYETKLVSLDSAWNFTFVASILLDSEFNNFNKYAEIIKVYTKKNHELEEALRMVLVPVKHLYDDPLPENILYPKLEINSIYHSDVYANTNQVRADKIFYNFSSGLLAFYDSNGDKYERIK